MARKAAQGEKAEPKTGLVGVLKLKVGACLTGPTRRLLEDLHATAADCRRVRNRAGRWWQRWREDHPEHEGPLLLTKDAAKERYDAMLLEAPNLATTILSSLCREVDKRLTARVPRDHLGEARYRWQAVLTGEVNLDTYHAEVVPLHDRIVRICYHGLMTGPTKGPVGSVLFRLGSSSCVLAFNLFSRKAGRRITNPVVRLGVRQMTPGQRRLVERIASGQWQHLASKLVFRAGHRRGEGDWYLHLVYRQPRQDMQLDPVRVAVLQPVGPEAPRPFTISTDGQKPWTLGFPGLLREYERLHLRRQSLRNRYREAWSARRGHGRERIEAGIRPFSRAVHDLANRALKLIVADVLRYARRNDCGTLIYREPAVSWRGGSWFAGHDVPFDWTQFLARLEQKCSLHGIALEVEETRGSAAFVWKDGLVESCERWPLSGQAPQ